MPNLRILPPKVAVAGGALCIVCALLASVLLWLGSTISGQDGYKPSASDIEAEFQFYIWCAVLFVGGILILRRRYIVGGALAVLCSILIAISAWYVGIWGIIGGVLSLLSKDEIPDRVLRVAKLHSRIQLKDIAAKIGKTEADVELAIINLQSKGQPIRFDTATREIIYG